MNRYVRFKEVNGRYVAILCEKDGTEVPRGTDADADAAYAEMDHISSVVDRMFGPREYL